MFVVLIIFLWQFSIKPFQINTNINIADNLVTEKKCDQAFTIMDQVVTQETFLYSYSRIKYVEFIKNCASFYPENNLAYAKKGVALMKEAVKIRPSYTRLWIFLGGFTTVIANLEENTQIKADLIKEANGYFDKAFQMSPERQETIIEKAKLDLVEKNYQKMKADTITCININDKLGDCYW